MRWARTWTSRRPGHGCGPAGGVTAYGGAWRGLIAWDGSALPGRWWHAQAGGSNRSSDYHLPTAPCLYVRVQGGVTGVGSEPAAAGRGGACACAEWSGLISGLSVGCGAVHAGLAGRAGAGGRERRLGRRGCVHPAEQRPMGMSRPGGRGSGSWSVGTQIWLSTTRSWSGRTSACGRRSRSCAPRWRPGRRNCGTCGPRGAELAQLVPPAVAGRPLGTPTETAPPGPAPAAGRTAASSRTPSSSRAGRGA